MKFELFAKEQIVGVFRGFREGGLEFHADLVLPYRSDFQCTPMHGQFVLVQLETPEEAVIGRITAFSSEGKLSSGAGEEFNIRAVREDRRVPENLREDYLKYRVNIRVLGVLRNKANGELSFVASHRRLPHVGSPVAFPSGPVLQDIAGHNIAGAPIGYLAFGEYVYAQGGSKLKTEDWMQIKGPEVLVKFAVDSLASRRSFIFARAGFGKSNLNKLLFSQLYTTTPTIQKRERKVPVGTVIFDPEGEYFWPDDKGRPGLCDVPHLEDKLVVFTSRRSSSAFYQSFVAGGIKLDIRRLRPSDVIGIALSPDRQDQQNVRKLRGLDPARWEELVNLIDRSKNSTPLIEIMRILDLDQERQEAEALAARANMTAIVTMLHDKSSQLMDMLIYALSQGKLCIVDVSQMRGAQSLILSGLILRRIFDRNQAEFTNANPQTIPTIAVVEEAQAVLNENATSAEPYISWVKEGRKYDLGAVMVTQQPGSIPVEILSQGDNWFIFHLLSATDLYSVSKANAHFSNDILSTLLNEPIPGQGVFWSSVSGKSYPISLRVLSFENIYPRRDSDYKRPAGNTFANTIKQEFPAPATQGAPTPSRPSATDAQSPMPVAKPVRQPESGPIVLEGESPDADTPDNLVALQDVCVKALENSTDLMTKIRGNGAAWGTVKALFLSVLPQKVDDRDVLAYRMVVTALNRIFGEQEKAWHAFKNPERANATYVKTGPNPKPR